mmetsp:Transcript_26490/g.84274  ORF Transcript_26490/g.84274 Transcript_26490/m.84274 type:complete len:226 (-) Transcript_26490:394-1071(-)
MLSRNERTSCSPRWRWRERLVSRLNERTASQNAKSSLGRTNVAADAVVPATSKLDRKARKWPRASSFSSTSLRLQCCTTAVHSRWLKEMYALDCKKRLRNERSSSTMTLACMATKTRLPVSMWSGVDHSTWSILLLIVRPVGTNMAEPSWQNISAISRAFLRVASDLATSSEEAASSSALWSDSSVRKNSSASQQYQRLQVSPWARKVSKCCTCSSSARTLHRSR